MARRSSFLEYLMDLPWPIGAVMAALCYPLALLLFGYLDNQPSHILQALAPVALKWWPLFSTLFGCAALVSFLRALSPTQKVLKRNQPTQTNRVSTSESPISSEPDATEVICPICDSGMVRKKARKGKYKGQQFWGCTKFPGCKGIIHI